MTVALVIVFGGIGALVRSEVSEFFFRTVRRGTPIGTLVVNVVGSFVLGCIAGGASGTAATILGTGFCGALTTYSAYAHETVQLARGWIRRSGAGRRDAIAYVVASVASGTAAAMVGIAAAGS